MVHNMPYIQELARTTDDQESATLQAEFELGPSPVKGDTGLLYFDIQLTGTIGGANPSIVGDLGHNVTALDIQIGGKRYLSYNPPRQDPDEAVAISPLGYLLHQAGGGVHMEELNIDGQVAVRCRIRVPIGRPTTKKESGYVRIAFGAFTGAAGWCNAGSTTYTSDQLIVQGVYGTVRHETHIASGINENIAASAEAPVRIHKPESNGGWLLDKVVVMDDAGAETIDTVRVVGLHEQPIDVEDLRFFSGDWEGIPVLNTAGTGVTSAAQTVRHVVGSFAVPCYGLNQNQVTLSVRSNGTGGINYYYGLWYRVAGGGTDQAAQPQQVQTSSATGGEQVLS